MRPSSVQEHAGMPVFPPAVVGSHFIRIDSIKKNGLDWVKELGRKNVEDLMTVIQWNEDNASPFLFC